MRIKECITDDIPLLAKMNQLLIEDEKAETELTLQQLEERMTNFISSEYKAFIFYKNESVLGYALCDLSKKPIYLRQFFICRDERRKGYGTQAFQELFKFVNTDEIDIDVYSWNKEGISFWESLDFKIRCYSMRLKKL